MADIQQAARWLQAGFDVQREVYPGWWLTPYYPRLLTFQVVCADDGQHELDLFDLQANDWKKV